MESINSVESKIAVRSNMVDGIHVISDERIQTQPADELIQQSREHRKLDEELKRKKFEESLKGPKSTVHTIESIQPLEKQTSSAQTSVLAKKTNLHEVVPSHSEESEIPKRGFFWRFRRK